MKVCTNVICKNVENYELVCPWFETLHYVLLCMRNITCLLAIPDSLVIMVKIMYFVGFICVCFHIGIS